MPRSPAAGTRGRSTATAEHREHRTTRLLPGDLLPPASLPCRERECMPSASCKQLLLRAGGAPGYRGTFHISCVGNVRDTENTNFLEKKSDPNGNSRTNL